MVLDAGRVDQFLSKFGAIGQGVLVGPPFQEALTVADNREVNRANVL